MAHVVLEARLATPGSTTGSHVRSAGTGGWHVGEPMDRRAAATLDRGRLRPEPATAGSSSPPPGATSSTSSWPWTPATSRTSTRLLPPGRRPGPASGASATSTPGRRRRRRPRRARSLLRRRRRLRRASWRWWSGPARRLVEPSLRDRPWTATSRRLQPDLRSEWHPGGRDRAVPSTASSSSTTTAPCVSPCAAPSSSTGTTSRWPATAPRRWPRIAAAAPDAVVMDVMMPRLDGIETTRALRAAGNDLPILVLTARDSVGDRVEGLDAGADDYLTKPFALEELLARLRALLRRTHHRGARRPRGRAADLLRPHAQPRHPRGAPRRPAASS